MKPTEGTDGGIDTETVSDGGTSPNPSDGPDPVDETTIFTQLSDVSEPTVSERLSEWFDRHVYAPGVVFATDWRAVIGSLLLIGFLLVGTLGLYVVPKPTVMEGPIFVQPFTTWEYPLGTGVMGKSILGQVVHATPAMLKMIAAGALLSVSVGTVIGTVAGYRGGLSDSILMIVTDVVLTIPGLALVIVLASIYQPEDPFVVGLILGIDNWPRLARTIRSQVLSIREEAFTESSRIMGLSELTILRKDVISNLMPYISVNFANSARKVIFESVGLYFLGILPFTTLNWGVMMNEAYNGANLTNPEELHWLLVPMALLILVSLGFILLAQGLDRVFNVRLRARHENTASASRHGREHGGESA